MVISGHRKRSPHMPGEKINTFRYNNCTTSLFAYRVTPEDTQNSARKLRNSRAWCCRLFLICRKRRFVNTSINISMSHSLKKKDTYSARKTIWFMLRKCFVMKCSWTAQRLKLKKGLKDITARNSIPYLLIIEDE